MRSRIRSVAPADVAHVAAFAGGMLMLVLALLSPIDSIGEQLFAVHMIQHLLLLVFAAPLFAWSRPAVVFLWALPLTGRKRVGSAWSRLGVRRGLRGLLHPLTVWFLFNGVFVFWHCPGPYTWAVHDETVHVMEHACLFVTGLMFWSVVLEPDGHRRLGYGGTLILIATTTVLSGLPGALMILASEPLYPVHAAGVLAWRLTLLQDQQLAGLIMWIPGGSIYLVAACLMFVKWLERPERSHAAA
jgi:cytochrome c oxidase assembly factor CtaG